MLLSSCTEEEKPPITEESLQDIYYEFHDSSVPPEYHRSYEINASMDEVKITVDSYGDILHEEIYQYEEGARKKLAELLNEVDGDCTISEPEPCSGGTSEYLEVHASGIDYELYLDHCGDNDFPDDCGDVRAAIDHLKSMIPNLDELLQ